MGIIEDQEETIDSLKQSLISLADKCGYLPYTIGYGNNEVIEWMTKEEFEKLRREKK